MARPLRLVASREECERSDVSVALVVVESPRIRRAVNRVLTAMGMELIIVDSLPAGRRWIERNRPALLIYDLDAAADPSELEAISEMEERPKLVLLSERRDLPMLEALARHSYGYNLLAKDGQIDNGDLLVTARKLVSGKIFGADKYLRWGSVVHAHDLVRSDERRTALDELRRVLEDLQCDQRYTMSLVNVADEFLTNAFFHGPTDPTGSVHLYSGRSREDVVELRRERRVTLEYGSDGRSVAVAVRDRFGSFDPSAMLAKLAECSRSERVGVRDGVGGAGIGLYMTHRTVNQLVVNLHPGFSTEFVGILDVSLPQREQRSAPRSLNVFLVS